MRIFAKLAAAATLTLAVSVAQASSITSATVYTNVFDPTNAAAPQNLTGPNHANFTIGAAGINFNQPGSATLSQFLNNPTYSNITGTFTPTAVGSDQNIELVITGFITLNAGANNFQIVHDDGAVITVGTPPVLVFNQPNATPPVTNNFTINEVSAGDYAFTILYTECCSPPADLIINSVGGPALFSTVPEPSSMAMFGTGILAFAGVVRRRFSHA